MPPSEMPRTVCGPAVTVVSIARVYGRGARAWCYDCPSMFWYSLLAALGILFLLSVSLAVPRRIWALAIYSIKYGLLWITDVVGLRRLWMGMTGRRAKYQRLTRPMLVRMWC